MLLLSIWFTIRLILLVLVGYSCTVAQFIEPPDEESLQCTGTGMLMFQGDGRFSVVRENSNGSLMCTGDVSVAANSTLYTRIISKGIFVCKSSSSVRICGYGDVELANSETTGSNIDHSLFQCNGEPLFPIMDSQFTNTYCFGEGNFSIQGFGTFTIEADEITCIADKNMTILPTLCKVMGVFSCVGIGPYTISGYGRPLSMISESENCSHGSLLATLKHCSGLGEYSLIGDGSYNISTKSGNISCFGDITEYGLYFTTFGPFYCEGEDMFLLDGIGFLYQTNTTDYDNCSSLIDSTNPVSNNLSIFTACVGKGAHVFFGNGNFYVSVYAVSSNHGLKCDGSVSDTHTSKGTLYTYSYGQFCCVSSGDLLINGTGVIEGDDIHCAVSPITAGEIFECSGTGEFEIVGLGFFSIVAIPEITCTGNGDLLQFDIGEKFMSRGRFACIGSEFFTVTGTGEIESVTTVLGSHNCTDMPVTSGSGGIDVVTCSGEGDYIIVGDGSFYINQTGLGMLQCIGEVISGVNTSQSAEYFINGEFRCAASGIVYFTGIGRAKIINASTSYECNGVFFPGPIMEPPFSGFGGDDITCFAYGETVIVGYGQIHMVTQSPTPLDCKGTVSFDLDQNLVESNGDFMCTGNDFIHINGRGEVFVNSTGFNNCTPCNDTISDDPLSCSGFGEHEIFGSANATIFASDALECNGDVFPLTSSNGSLYYIGGCYRCTSHGSFSINGLGNATIHSTSGVSNYNCIGGPQLLNCATFAIDGIMDENVILIGVGEFTIIGDEKLYCKGNAVLCPGEINYYFTDGHFYCSSDVFVHINGTGTIENITGANNCSGFGFGVLPIASGALLTPQPSCIGFGNHYQINGNGTFDISRLIGSLNCNVRLQEPNSDVYTFSSIEELFNCSGNGIFVLDGFGDSFIILDNGYFNCVDTSVEPTSSFIDPTPDPTPSSIASTLSLIDPTSIATEPTSVLITVGPILTALVVQEPNQTVVIQITNFTPFPPSGAVPLTITYVTTDGTATGGSDYTSVNNGYIILNPFQPIPNIVISIEDDTDVENNETFFVSFTGCSPGCTIQSAFDTVTVTIESDDVFGTGQDPHFIVPLMGHQKFCYSMQGMANFAFNLLSDYFISINAYFVLPEEEKRSRFKEYATFIGDIGILIRLDGQRGKNKIENITKISISASDHSVSVDGIKTVVSDHSVIVTIDNRSTMVSADNTVDKKTKPGLTLTVKQPKLSFQVTFVHNHIDLVFIDDSGISHNCHGIMGQFLHKEATIVENKLLEINGRFIPIEKLPAWDFVHINDTCLHAKPKHGFQAEGIIEGKYTDYVVDSLFSPHFSYSKFKSLT